MVQFLGGRVISDILDPVIATFDVPLRPCDMPHRSPGVVIDRPRQGPALREHLFRRAEVVVDDMKQHARLTTGHGAKAIRFKEPVNLAGARDHVAVPQEILALPGAFLPDPPPEGVIAIAPAAMRAIRRDQLILRVPFEGPSLRAKSLARDRPPHNPAAGVVLQRHDLATRAVGDAHDASSRGLPVQETVGIRARRRDVQIGAIGETLGPAIAILRARDLAVLVIVVTLFAPAGTGDDARLIGAGLAPLQSCKAVPQYTKSSPPLGLSINPTGSLPIFKTSRRFLHI